MAKQFSHEPARKWLKIKKKLKFGFNLIFVVEIIAIEITKKKDL